MFINIDNPALNIRNSPAVLFVGCLQHRAAARVEGWTALGLHLGGEGGLVSGLALNVVNLQQSQFYKNSLDLTSPLTFVQCLE